VASGGLIILAEDDPLIRRLYADALRIAGYTILAASSGDEALGFIAKAKPRLLILDVMMPGLNGIEVCKRARKTFGDDVPIVFLTALDRIDILRDCIAAGGDDYIIKTDSLKSMVERIKTWLQHGQRQGLTARRTKLLRDLRSRSAATAI